MARIGMLGGVMLALAWSVQAHVQPALAADNGRVVESFDANWRFLQANLTGGEKVEFDDSGWRTVDVPHDWSIVGPFDSSNRTGAGGGFLPSGVGWYRKHFALPAGAGGERRVFIEFDGVMQNSEVWINGYQLGKRPNGYVSFRYELTGFLQRENVIAVRADTSAQPASRWYAGSGIYRHVRLVSTEPVHLAQYGTFVTTPLVTPDFATVHVKHWVVNNSKQAQSVSVESQLVGPDGKPAGSATSPAVSIAAGATVEVEQDVTLVPQLWDLRTPNMYQCVSRVRIDATVVDAEVTPFGIRDARFAAEKGFILNGKGVKLQGVCLHQDMGGLGVAVPLAAWEHRLAALKALGCNAIRTAHNPMAPEFLDACDRMGFLVMDELFDCWQQQKTPYDYHLNFKAWSAVDLRDTVRRDRNHPSIILYSAGNEIRDTTTPATAIPILKALVGEFHQEDPSRPVTQALFRPNSDGNNGAYRNGLANLLDVVGTNYRYTELLAAQKAKPTIKIVGTENAKDKENWLAVRNNAGYSGEFLWTGADYLGESKAWPAIMNDSGLLDITDTPRPIAFMFASWWSDKPVVKMARAGGDLPTGNIPDEPQSKAVESNDWSPGSATPREERVLVYSNAPSVELFLNGKSLTAQKQPADGGGRTWRIVFQPGTLSAVASDGGGKMLATETLVTAGNAAKVVLTTDHAAIAPVWDDIAFVTATITDEKGTRMPLANDMVTFDVEGPGRIVAVESGSPTSHEPFQTTEHRAFNGTVTALVRATAQGGKIKISASVRGLAAGSITLDAKAKYAGYWKPEK